ncbi:conserved hypothetical protein [Histoplasma capsulatum H143]|uniref:Uncharacterized protein n=1 Tax=Ajellomyces capsulatus (strain H143) TaxID=544712 RepID=C6H5N8_AJECH|nr:conserved hypothetical protein [Histoplasma capsulatum H143]
MSSPLEPSVLEYARFHNIATSGVQDPLLLVPPVIEDINLSLRDTPNFPSIDLETIQSEIRTGTREKVDASWASAHMLSSIAKSFLDETSMGNHPGEGGCPSNFGQVRDMKLEAPLLRTDHEIDMRMFRRRISLDFIEIDVPLEQLDDENDESLKFPSNFWSQPMQLCDVAQAERLSCVKDGLMLMQEIKSQVAAPGKRDVDDWLSEGITFCRKRKDIDPQTPILLPRDPAPGPFEPPSPCLEMEILSDAETPPMVEFQDAQDIEDTLMTNGEQIVADFLTTNSQAQRPGLPADGSNETSQDFEDLTSLPIVQNITQDLKIETPITPPISTKKRAAGSNEDILNAMARTRVFSEIASHDAVDIESISIPEDDLEEVVSAAKRKAEDELNSDRIRSINPTIRCNVPCLRSPIKSPPWPVVAGQSKTELKRLCRSFISEIKQKDFGIRYAMGEDHKKDLKWQPFSLEVRRLEVKENLDPEDAVGEFLRGIGRRLDSSENEEQMSTPVYPYDFRLSTLEDNEELMPRELYEKVGLVSSLQGKACAHYGDDKAKDGGSGYSHTEQKFKGIDNKTGSLKAMDIGLNVKFAEATLVGSGLSSLFSPLDSLSNFMEVRGRRPTDSHSDSFPHIAHPAPHHSTVLAQDNPRPKTGVLLTTTQEITQKYLPGHQPNGQGIAQELNYPVRRRISEICLLYEEVYVFICNPIVTLNKDRLTRPYVEMEMNDRTVKAIESLKTFCESLNHFSTINAFPVVNDASIITDWLVSLASKHYTMTPWSASNIVHELGKPAKIRFPEDTSPSENFLRQCGLNSFAAQMVLLHPYNDADDDNGLHYSGGHSIQATKNPKDALFRFASMNPFERKRIFIPLLGQRVFERMERRLAVELNEFSYCYAHKLKFKICLRWVDQQVACFSDGIDNSK